jgi:two-component system phosphate regulon sensor histidine kinase PhoR
VRRKRLLYRLFLSYLWITIAAVVLGGLYGARVMRQFHRQQTEKDLEARAKLCSEQILALLDEKKTAEIDALCKELGNAAGVDTRITVILPDGKVVGDTAEDPQHMDNHKGRPEIRQAVASERSLGSSIRYSHTTKEDRMYVAVALRRGGRLIAVVRTSIPLTAIQETIAGLYQRIVVAGLLAAAVIAGVSLWISRRISRPLEEMEAGAQRFARGDLGHRLPDSDCEEIAALSTAMNEMASQLGERISAVTRQQNELQAMLVSMDEGVLAVDPKGRIISLNQAFADLLHAQVDELRGRIIHEVIRKPDLLQFMESALSSTVPVEETIELHDAEDLRLRARGTALLDAQQEKIGALVVLHDITRLLRLETVRRDFVANVSHELGTPITAIKGFVESLLDGALEDQENARRFLRIVLRQVDRLDAMADDLLTLSRLESQAEQQAVELRPDCVRSVLQAAVQTCETIAVQYGVRLELQCSDDLVTDIDPALLERAVMNLIDNAVKYSGPDTVVQVTGERVDGRIVIRVKDRGCGIAAKHLSRLFERFYRVDKARSRERGGTGLGLAIVKHIAVLHHGSVEVTSAVGVGSTFTIRLPETRPCCV